LLLCADLALVTAADLAHLPVDRRLSIAGVVLIRQPPGSIQWRGGCYDLGRDGDANLIIWPAILERFRRAPLGATPLRSTGKLQREESVIHVVAERLDDLTPRLDTLRGRTGDAETGRARKRLSHPRQKPTGYDPRDIVIASRNFRRQRADVSRDPVDGRANISPTRSTSAQVTLRLE
jgi:error-prone DNA polymerase